MSLDHLLSQIEEIEAEGAIVLIKWDGERQSRRRTVVVTRADTDYAYRRDSDDVPEALQEAIADYRSHHD